MLSLLGHIWKGTIRSIVWHRNLGVNIFLGILFFILFLNFLSIGLFIDRIFEESLPGKDPIAIFNSIQLYYFGIDLLLRYLIQQAPGVIARPYLHLPISRRKIAHFSLLRSLFSIFNFLPLLIFLPFVLKIILPKFGITSAVSWFFSLTLLILCNNFLFLYLEKLAVAKLKASLFFISVLVALFLADKLEVVSLSSASVVIFDSFIQFPILIIGPLTLLAFIYLLNLRIFVNYLYLDRLGLVHTKSRLFSGSFSYLDKFGEVGEYIALELKLLLRNKRSRSTLIFALVMLVIAPYFYTSMLEDQDFYPRPKQIDSREDLAKKDMPGFSNVTFTIVPDSLPDSAYVYITGDHISLGKWKPAHLPLISQKDGTWSRTISFRNDEKLRYIFTLGSWETECIQTDSEKPDVQTLEVKADTTIVYANPSFKTPKRRLFVDIMMVYMGVLFIGILMLVYGQFLLCWESMYFDTILTHAVNFKKYFTAKYVLLVAAGMIMYLLMAPLAFISIDLLYINSIVFIYSVGFNSIVLLFLSTFARKRMDLTVGIFSQQGKGAAQFITVLGSLFIVLLIFIPAAVIFSSAFAFTFLLIIGLAGLVFHNQVLRFIVAQFYRQKYKISSGFRQL